MSDFDETLIRTYAMLPDTDLEEITVNDQSFWSWYLANDELEKRRRAKNEQDMIGLTRQVTLLTYIIGVFTATNVVLVGLQVFRQ